MAPQGSRHNERHSERGQRPASAHETAGTLVAGLSKSGHAFKNRFELEVRDRQYGFPVGLVRGQVAAHGSEVDFYNEDLCDLAFPEGVGRYRWSVNGELLYLAGIEDDQCATRRGVLDGAKYRRLH
jgi:hypothetical protein